MYLSVALASPARVVRVFKGRDRAFTGMVSGPVEVVLDGGSLWIDWSGQANDSVFMTSPWAESFQGRFEIDDHG